MKKFFSIIFFSCTVCFFAVSQQEEHIFYRKNIGIEGVFNESVQKQFEKYYTDENKRIFLSTVLYNSAPYRPYIIEQLEKRKMPLFLQYLPVVESDYKPYAVSLSGATGLWQFMENSMHPFLKKNEWIDERLDPWKETDAALTKLSDNYRKFKNWHLALAAYNMGAGAVERIIKSNPGKDFWQLAEENLLSRQSCEYVPKLIAVTEAVENAEYYGFIEIGAADEATKKGKIQKFKFYKVKGKSSLKYLAEKTGIPYETLKFYNPELIKECTPPEGTYRLRAVK
ncbi:MAG: lytic transglycosylase domain-containing protein [Treponema sp.]|nr:lytic transglycosylase domain-containing protein [Treponema sp.]